MQEGLKLLVARPDGSEDPIVEELRNHLPGVEFTWLSTVGAVASPEAVRSDVALVECGPSLAEGLEVVRRLHAVAPRLPILVLSMLDDEARALEALRAGAHDYVIRSHTDPRTLARLIRYAIERKNLERSLQDSEEFFHLIWDNLTDLIAILDADGRRIYNSPSYRAVLGEPAELMGTDSFLEIHPEDRERIRRLFKESLATGQGSRADFRFLLRDGSVRHIESQATVISDKGGKPKRVLVVGRDVTDQRRAEAELREREEFFRLISENVSDFIAVLSKDGRRIYNNPSYQALFGDVGALRGSDSFAEIHPDDQAMVRQVFDETIATGQRRRIEYRFLLKNRQVRFMESVGSVVRDASGRPDRVVVVSRDVTERKQSEDAIRESEERYGRLLASTSDYNFSVTVLEGRSVATTHSPGCLPVTGYAADEFQKDPQLWYSIIFGPDRQAVLDYVDRILKGETPPPLEHRILRKDGQLRWIRNTVVPRKNREGLLITYDGLISDVTERRRAEQLLGLQYRATGVLAEAGTLSDALGRILSALCADLECEMGIFWGLEAGAAALQATATWASPESGIKTLEATSQRTRIPREDPFLGAVWRELRPMWVQGMASRLPAEYARQAEQHGIRTAFAVPVTSGDELVGVIEFCSRQDRKREDDLLEMLTAVASQVGQFVQRKRLDQAAQESQKRLELVIQGSSDGVWDWDLRTDEVYFSPRWKGMLGYADEEIPNRIEAWKQLMHPEDADQAMRKVQDHLEGRSPVYELEHRLRHKDGTYRWILARGAVQRDSAGLPVRMAGSHVDLTGRKRAEEQLRSANEELARSEEELRHKVADLHTANAALREAQLRLIQAAKMEVVGTLAAGVAHEVKNPLQTLVLGVDYLTSLPETTDKVVVQVLEDMRQAVERADKIVRGLLEFSATNQPERSHHDLNTLIRQALHLAAFALSRSQVKVKLDLEERTQTVWVEANKIEQALINLIVNAVHAMPDGGTLAVRSRWQNLVAGDSGQNAAEAVVEIEDTGKGIPSHVLARVFDPFFTTKPQGVGSGLGLSVTKRIIELHGGQIQLQNRAEGGVCATIRLPVEPAAISGPGMKAEAERACSEPPSPLA